MSIRQKAAQFFRNVADYFEPRFIGHHPSHAHEELYRQSLNNFTGRDWTQEEINQLNTDYMHKVVDDLNECMQQLKRKEKTPSV